MTQQHQPTIETSRRRFLESLGGGFGALAMAGLAGSVHAASKPSEPKGHDGKPHFQPRARRVIRLFMQGGPSHVDTFDYKPELIANHGKSARQPGGRGRGGGKLLAPKWKFQQCGESGLPISDRYPHLQRHADELCLLNGMHTDAAAHPQATIMAHTGSLTFVRPSVGAWVLYGLGAANADLPGFVTINPLNRLGGAQNYGSAFLPASFQATKINQNRIANLSNAATTKRQQRKQLDLMREMNEDLMARAGGDAAIEGVIDSFELAFRMQDSVPDVLDIRSEPDSVRELYGLDKGPTRTFGTQCLMARRLAEAGVRYIEINHNGWDQHNNLQARLERNTLATDQPIAGLIADLKMRGLLDDTLIMWGGEFGRTPTQQAANGDGRRHNNRGYTTWLAGGGVKGGIRHGATDPLGFVAAEGKVHIHDLHATVLHLLGLDHKRLTYRYSGRDFRLTDVHGHVVKDILA